MQNNQLRTHRKHVDSDYVGKMIALSGQLPKREMKGYQYFRLHIVFAAYSYRFIMQKWKDYNLINSQGPTSMTLPTLCSKYYIKSCLFQVLLKRWTGSGTSLRLWRNL